MSTRSRWLVLAAFATACGGSGQRAERSGEAGGDARASASPVGVRFVLETTAGEGPLYVQVSDAESQPGWITVSRAASRVYLRERCDIPDCGNNTVCGASLPMVRQLRSAGMASTIEFVWDGLTSVVGSSPRCEDRSPATSGTYLARFCYSTQAEFDGPPPEDAPTPGRVLQPTCTERAFTLEEGEVVLRI